MNFTNKFLFHFSKREKALVKNCFKVKNIFNGHNYPTWIKQKKKSRVRNTQKFT